ncbi:uncharacterized protein LOC135819351 isoform X2 [Sycon ciliatum]|uniref:uncharacterized protein LOC135819351 isoform X2 n=1 Tax=Sycon ciliatum TaxID=27933 RepID=UPI0031F66DFB
MAYNPNPGDVFRIKRTTDPPRGQNYLGVRQGEMVVFKKYTARSEQGQKLGLGPGWWKVNVQGVRSKAGNRFVAANNCELVQRSVPGSGSNPTASMSPDGSHEGALSGSFDGGAANAGGTAGASGRGFQESGDYPGAGSQPRDSSAATAAGGAGDRDQAESRARDMHTTHPAPGPSAGGLGQPTPARLLVRAARDIEGDPANSILGAKEGDEMHIISEATTDGWFEMERLADHIVGWCHTDDVKVVQAGTGFNPSSLDGHSATPGAGNDRMGQIPEGAQGGTGWQMLQGSDGNVTPRSQADEVWRQDVVTAQPLPRQRAMSDSSWQQLDAPTTGPATQQTHPSANSEEMRSGASQQRGISAGPHGHRHPDSRLAAGTTRPSQDSGRRAAAAVADNQLGNRGVTHVPTTAHAVQGATMHAQDVQLQQQQRQQRQQQQQQQHIQLHSQQQQRRDHQPQEQHQHPPPPRHSQQQQPQTGVHPDSGQQRGQGQQSALLKVLADYTSTVGGDISAQAGDECYARTAPDSNGYIQIKLLKTGNVGWIPATYVEESASQERGNQTAGQSGRHDRIPEAQQASNSGGLHPGGVNPGGVNPAAVPSSTVSTSRRRARVGQTASADHLNTHPHLQPKVGAFRDENVTVIGESREGFCYIKLQRDGSAGYFPEKYLIIQSQLPRTPTTPSDAGSGAGSGAGSVAGGGVGGGAGSGAGSSAGSAARGHGYDTRSRTQQPEQQQHRNQQQGATEHVREFAWANANVYPDSSVRDPVELYAGQKVGIIRGPTNNWYRVRVEETGEIGHVYSDYITFTEPQKPSPRHGGTVEVNPDVKQARLLRDVAFFEDYLKPFARQGEILMLIGDCHDHLYKVMNESGAETKVFANALKILQPAQLQRVLDGQQLAQPRTDQVQFPVQCRIIDNVYSDDAHAGYLNAYRGDMVTVTGPAGYGVYRAQSAYGEIGTVPASAVDLPYASRQTQDRGQSVDFSQGREGTNALLNFFGIRGGSSRSSAICSKYNALLQNFYQNGDVCVLDVHNVFKAHNLQEAADIRQICTMSSMFIKQTDDLHQCFKLVTIILMEIGQRATVHGVLASQEYKSFVEQCDEVSKGLQEGFDRDILGPAAGDLTACGRDFQQCFGQRRDLISRVITSLMGHCRETNVYLIVSLIALDFWMGSVFDWRLEGRWLRYMEALVWKSTGVPGNAFLSVLAAKELDHFFSIPLDAEALLACVGQLYNSHNMDESTAVLIWTKLVVLKLHESRENVKAFLHHISRHSTARRKVLPFVLAHASTSIGPEIALEFFNAMQLGLDFDMAARAANQAVTNLSQADNIDGFLTINKGLVDYCFQNGVKPTVDQLLRTITSSTANRSALSAGIILSITFLKGDARLKVNESRQEYKRRLQVMDLLNAVAKQSKNTLIKEYPEVILNLHAKFGSDIRNTVGIIDSSPLLSQFGGFSTDVPSSAASVLANMRFSEKYSVKEFLQEAVDVLNLTTDRRIRVSPDSASTLLWMGYCYSARNHLASLLQDGVSIAAGYAEIVSMPKKVRQSRSEPATLEAIFYSTVLDVLQVYGPIWAVTGVDSIILKCSHVYSRQSQATSWARNRMSGYVSAVSELDRLQISMIDRSYTKAEYNRLSESLSALNTMFAACGSERVPRLPNPDDVIQRMKKNQKLADWLHSRSVPNAGDAAHDLDVLSTSSTATLCVMEKRVDEVWKRFGEPLRDQVASDCPESLVHFILYFSSNSKIFDDKSHTEYDSSSSMQDRAWVRRIRNAIKQAHGTFTNLLNGISEYRIIRRILENLQDVNLTEELALIQAYPPYQRFQRHGSSAGHITVAVAIIEHLRNGHVNDIKNVLSDMGIVDDGDSDMLYLERLGTSISDESTLASFAQEYETLYQLFDGLQADHFKLFKEMASGNCDNIRNFFATDYHSDDGRREFQAKVDHLNMRMQRDSFNNNLLSSLLDTHKIMSPFFPLSQKKPLRAILQAVANIRVNLHNVKTCNEQTDCIIELFKKAIASATETTIDQLTKLSSGGNLTVELGAMSCSSSVFSFSYQYSSEMTQQPANGEQQRHGHSGVMKEREVKDFRSNLQYLRSMQGENDITAPGQSQTIGRMANDFADVLAVVDKVIELLFHHEEEGHPEYQNCLVTFSLDKEGLQRKAAELQDQLSDWSKKLAEVRRQCRLLRLFTNKDIATILALYTPETGRQAAQQLCTGRSMRETAIFKLADINLEQDAPREDIVNIAAKLVSNYVRSLSNIAQIKEGCDLADCISKSMEERSTDYDRIMQMFRRLLETELVLRETRLPSQQGKQYICAAERTDASKGNLSNTLMLLCTIFLYKHKCLPCTGQVLFCSERTSNSELQAFFTRIAAFPQLIFAMVGVELLGYNERSLLLEQQHQFDTDPTFNSVVYYICLDPTICSWWPQSYVTSLQLASQPIRALSDCLKSLLGHGQSRPELTAVVGRSGSGKSHYIVTQLRSDPGAMAATVAVSGSGDTSNVIRKLSALDNKSAVFFNLSSHVDMDYINRVFFELIVCGTLGDPEFSALFTLPQTSSWKWFVEIPHCEDKDDPNATCESLAKRDYPMISLLSEFHTVTEMNNPIHIGQQERRMAAILTCYYQGRLDPPVGQADQGDEMWQIAKGEVLDDNECRVQLQRLFSDMKLTNSTKMHQMAFLRYLYDRLELFNRVVFISSVSFMYWNLATKALLHFMRESHYLGTRGLECMWQKCKQYFLIADPTGGSFATLEPPERAQLPVSSTMLLQRDGKEKALLAIELESEPAGYLSWAFGLSMDRIKYLLDQKQFVLTRDFMYKLLLINERKKARLPLIIEGETGVGKTFLLEMYTKFMNYEAAYSAERESAPRPISRCCGWICKLVLGGLWKTMKKESRMWFAGNENETYPQQKHLAAEQEERLNHEFFHTPEQLGTFWRELLEDHLDDETRKTAIDGLSNQVEVWLKRFPILKPVATVNELRGKSSLSTVESAELLSSYVSSPIENLFFKLLIHPGISKQALVAFMEAPRVLAARCPDQEVVVFFDEVNTSSCLGVFKEMLIDRMLDGKPIEDNIFFISAINPSLAKPAARAVASSTPALPSAAGQQPDANADLIDAFRQVYFVHDLPEVMNQLKWVYGSLSTEQELKEYIAAKIDVQKNLIVKTDSTIVEFSLDLKKAFASILLRAHQYCILFLGNSSVSQRDIQRVFLLIPFFWHVEENLMKERQKQQSYAAITNVNTVLKKSISLAIAVVYYFRLPREPINDRSSISHGVCRSGFQHYLHSDQTGIAQAHMYELADLLAVCPKCSDPQYEGVYALRANIDEMINDFVTREHFSLPEGVALTEALKENIFCTVACIQTRIPLGIVGQPGSSKTLSFHIVRDNLRGEHSVRPFCKQFVAIDSFFYQCSEQSTSEQVASVFDNAIERQNFYNQQASQERENVRRSHVKFVNNEPVVKEVVSEAGAQQSKVSTHCVVFLDEAGLPTEEKSKMVLKVLHPYLDDRKVAFVALSNHWFDAANANRMVTLYRSQADLKDLVALALGCIKRGGPQAGEASASNDEQLYITGLCEGYQDVTRDTAFAKLFHHRDLIYLLRHHYRNQLLHNKRQIPRNPNILLEALEENFGGMVNPDDFCRLADMFFSAVARHVDNYPTNISDGRFSLRNTVKILRDINVANRHVDEQEFLRTGHPLAPRFRMIIDPTDDYTALDIMRKMNLVDSHKTHVIHMSNLSGDEDELHSAEILARIRRFLEMDCTIVLVETRRVHGSLYELLNQTFRVIHNDGGRHIYANIAVGATTYPCRVNPHFQCVVILKHTEMEDSPTPFLSRFSKFVLRPMDAMQYALNNVDPSELSTIADIRDRCKGFMEQMGSRNFYGCNMELTPNALMISHLHSTVNDRFTFVPVTSCTAEVREQFKASVVDDAQLSVRSLCARLLQLLPTEHFVLGLKTLNDPAAYLTIYFDILEHFSLQHIISVINKRALHQSHSMSAVASGIVSVNKFMIYTRSSLAVSRLAGQPSEYFGNETATKLEIADTSTFRKCSEAEVFLEKFVKSQKTCAILLVDTSNGVSSAMSIALFKHLINEAAVSLRTSVNVPAKSFVLLLHSPLYIPSSKRAYPCPLLDGWDCCFMDLPGGVNVPLMNVKALAKSCALHGLARSPEGNEQHSDDVDEARESEHLAASLEHGLMNIKEELSRVFCSRLGNINTPADIVSSLEPRDLIPLYTPSGRLSPGSGLTASSLSERSRTVTFILTQYPSILKHIGRRLFHRFTPQRSFQLLDRLAKHVAQRKSFFSFADLVEMHMRPELENIFQKVMVTLCKDFGLATLIRSQVPEATLGTLLGLIPRMTVQDERSYNQHLCSISCAGRVVETPLFAQWKHRVESFIRNIDMEEPTACDLLHKRVKNDECLGQLIECEDLMDKYMTDLIATVCNWTGSMKAVKTAKIYLTLKFKEHKESAPEDCDRLSHMHYVLHMDERSDVLLVLHGSGALEHLLEPGDFDADQYVLSQKTTTDSYLDQFAECLFRNLWSHLTSLKQRLGTDEWWSYMTRWRQSYRFITEFFKPTDTALLSNERDEHAGVQEDFFNAVQRVYSTQAPLLRLMVAADIFFGSHTLCKTDDAVRALLETISRLKSEGLTTPLDVVKQIVSTLSGKCDEADRTSLYLEYLKWILHSLLKCESSKVLTYVLQAINQTAEEKVKMTFETATQLFMMITTQQKQLGARDDVLCIFLEDQVSKELLRDAAPRCLEQEFSAGIYIPGLYIPKDFPEAALPARPEVIKGILSMQLAHVFYSFMCQQQEKRHIEFNDRVTDADPAGSTITAQNFSPGLMLRFAAFTRVAFSAAATKIASLVEAPGGPESADDVEGKVAALKPLLNSLCGKHAKCDAWLSFLVSRLLSTHPAQTLIRLLKMFDGDWVAKCLQMVGGSVSFSQNTFVFMQVSSAAREDDKLPGTHDKYQEFSSMFEASVAADNNFKAIKEWYTQHSRPNAPKLIPNMESRHCASMFIFLKVYRDYFMEEEMDRVRTLGQALPLTPLLRDSLRLLCRGCTVAVPDLKAIFKAGKCPTPELQYARDIIVHCLAYILATGQPGNHLTTCVYTPRDFHKTLLFGAVNYRGYIDPDPTGVRIDCCCQFDHDGKPTYLASSAQTIPVALTPLGTHLNALLTFTGLCLHGVTQSNTAADTLEAVLTESDVQTECSRAGSFLQQALQFCLNRIVQLHYHLYHDDSRLNPDSGLGMVISSLERLLHLQSTSSAQQLKPFYPADERTVGLRQESEAFFQKEVVDHTLHLICVRLQRGTSDGDQVAAFRKLHRPSLSMADVQGAVARLSTSQDAAHPVLHGLLGNLEAFQSLRYATDIANFYMLLHRYLACHVSEAESQKFSFSEAVATLNQNRRHQDRLRKFFKKALESFNKFHNRIGGTLQPGACSTRVRYEALDDDNPIHYMISTQAEDEGDILFRVMQEILRHQDLFLVKCQEVKVQGSNEALRYSLQAGQFEDKISMLQVASYGAGLLRVSSDDMEQTCLMHSQLVQDADGVWQSKFNLAAIEQSLVQQYVNSARIVDLANFRVQFRFREDQSEQSVLYLEPLAADLPTRIFHQELDHHSRDAISQELKRQHYQESLKVLQHLVTVSTEVVMLKPTSESREGVHAEMERIGQMRLDDFLEQQQMPAMKQSLSAISNQDSVRMCHIVDLYTAVKEHLTGHEYLYMRIPHLLKEKMESSLDEKVEKALDDYFYEQLGELALLSIIDIADEALSVLQDSVPHVQNYPGNSLKETLDVLGVLDAGDVLSRLPDDVRGQHLKEVMAKLVRHGCTAREKQVERRQERAVWLEWDGEVPKAPGWLQVEAQVDYSWNEFDELEGLSISSQEQEGMESPSHDQYEDFDSLPEARNFLDRQGDEELPPGAGNAREDDAADPIIGIDSSSDDDHEDEGFVMVNNELEGPHPVENTQQPLDQYPENVHPQQQPQRRPRPPSLRNAPPAGRLSSSGSGDGFRSASLSPRTQSPPPTIAQRQPSPALQQPPPRQPPTARQLPHNIGHESQEHVPGGVQQRQQPMWQSSIDVLSQSHDSALPVQQQQRQHQQQSSDMMYASFADSGQAASAASQRPVPVPRARQRKLPPGQVTSTSGAPSTDVGSGGTAVVSTAIEQDHSRQTGQDSQVERSTVRPYSPTHSTSPGPAPQSEVRRAPSVPSARMPALEENVALHRDGLDPTAEGTGESNTSSIYILPNSDDDDFDESIVVLQPSRGNVSDTQEQLEPQSTVVNQELSKKLNVQALAQSDTPRLSLSTQELPLTMPCSAITNAPRGISRRQLVLRGDSTSEQEPVKYGGVRGKVLQKACKTFEVEESTVLIADCNGYVLKDTEDPAKHVTTNLCVYYVVKAENTIEVTFHLHGAAADSSAQVRTMQAQFENIASLSLLCTTALRLFGFTSPIRAILCSSDGVVFTDESLQGLLQSHKETALHLHTGSSQLVAVFSDVVGISAPLSSVLHSAVEDYLASSLMDRANSAFYPPLSSLPADCTEAQVMFVLDAGAMCDTTVVCGQRQVTLELVKCTRVELLHRELHDWFSVGDPHSMLTWTPSDGIEQVVPDMSILHQYTTTQSISPANHECRMSLLVATAPPHNVVVDVSVFQMLRTSITVDVHQRTVKDLVKELSRQLRLTAEVEALASLIDTSTMCELLESSLLEPSLPLLPQPALHLALQTRRDMFTVTIRAQDHEQQADSKALTLVAADSITAQHLLGKASHLLELTHYFQQSRPVGVASDSGIWLPGAMPLARLPREDDGTVVRIGVLDYADCCVVRLKFPSEQFGLFAVPMAVATGELLKLAAQIASSESSLCSLLVEQKSLINTQTTATTAMSMLEFLTQLKQDHDLPGVETLGTSSHPLECDVSLSVPQNAAATGMAMSDGLQLAMADASVGQTDDTIPVRIALLHDPDTVQEVHVPAQTSISKFYSSLCESLGLNPSEQHSLYAQSLDSEQPEHIEIESDDDGDDGEGNEDTMISSLLTSGYTSNFYIEAPALSSVHRLQPAEASFIRLPSNTLSLSEETFEIIAPTTLAAGSTTNTLSVKVQLLGDAASIVQLQISMTAVFSDLIGLATEHLRPGHTCTALSVDGEDIELGEEELSSPLTDILDGSQLVELTFTS